MRMHGFLAAIVLAATVVSTGHSPASGQRAANLSGRDIPASERARDTMNRFAACVVKARPTMVQRALAEPSRVRRNVALNEVVKKECLAGGMLQMDPTIFEGALYRALYLREFGEDSPNLQALTGGEPLTAALPLQVFGDCVVRAAPAEVHAFLASAPVTPEEDAALRGLGPAFGGCVAADDQISFSPASLQAVLAEAAYKRARASIVASN